MASLAALTPAVRPVVDAVKTARTFPIVATVYFFLLLLLIA